MTRIFTDGAEMGDLLFWSATNCAINAGGRSGSYCYFLDHGIYAQKYFSPVSECYFRLAIIFSTAAPPNYDPAYPLAFRSGANRLLWIDFTGSNGFLTFRTPDRTLCQYEEVIDSGVWYLLEFHFRLSDSNGCITMKNDGKVVVDYRGDTKYSTYTTFDNIYFYPGRNVVGGPALYLDDMALNNINGSMDNSWCGDGKTEILIPNGEGDLTEWACSTGTTHYTLVDDIPSNSDTDYVYAQGIPKQDRFNLGSFNDTSKLVERIWIDSRVKDVSGGGGQIKTGFKTGSTVYLQSSSTNLTTSYTMVNGDVAMFNPATSARWNKSDLDGLQIVVESEI